MKTNENRHMDKSIARRCVYYRDMQSGFGHDKGVGHSGNTNVCLEVPQVLSTGLSQINNRGKDQLPCIYQTH